MQYTVTLGQELDAFLQSAIEAGHYASPQEIIRDALLQFAEVQELDDDLRESLAQAANADVVEMEQVFDELERELAELNQRSSA